MKNVGLLIFVILVNFLPNELSSQCPMGIVILKSQEQVDQFKIDYPNCSKLEGSLGLCFPTIDIVNLDGLSNIDTIMGSLFAGEDCKLKSLVGLENLKYIGENLSFQEFGGPVDLQGLNNLERIEGHIRFDELGGLKSFEGLDNLKSIGGDLDLEDNYQLQELKGMPMLTTIGGDVNIEWHNQLYSLGGLDQLTSVGGSMDIEKNDSLINIKGFPALNSIGGYLDIRRNENLVSIEAFGNSQLTIGDHLRIYQNPELMDLSGLKSLISINGVLEIRENRKLASLEGLNTIDPFSIVELLITDCDSLSYCSVKSICDYLQIDMASFFFDLNAEGCNSGVEVATICADPTSAEELTAKSNIKIFPNPSSGLVNIQCSNDTHIDNYVLSTMQGQLLKIIPNPSSNINLDLSNLPIGVYLLTSSSHPAIYRKIVKY